MATVITTFDGTRRKNEVD